MDPDMFQEEVWAWTLLETIEEVLAEQRLEGQLAVPWEGRIVEIWQRRERDLLEGCTEEERDFALDWVSRDFLRRTDYWRSRVGWCPEINLVKDRDIEWDIPANQEGFIIIKVQHPLFEDVVTKGVLGGIGGRDNSDLIRVYWVKKLWQESPNTI